MENLKTMKVELTYVNRTNKISKTSGKPYTAMSLKTKEHGDAWINGFGGKDNQYWAKGDIVEIEVYEDEWNGKKSLKFNTPRVDPNAGIAELKTKVQSLEDRIMRIEKATPMSPNCPL